MATVASVAFINGSIITNTSAQSTNLTSIDAYGPGTVVRDSVIILPEEKTIPTNDQIYLGDMRQYITALNNKGQALEKLGNDTGAILYYKKALARQPNDTNTLDNIGMALTKLGNYTGAIDFYNRALAINPNDEAALYNKGDAFDHLGFPSF